MGSQLVIGLKEFVFCVHLEELECAVRSILHRACHVLMYVWVSHGESETHGVAYDGSVNGGANEDMVGP